MADQSVEDRTYLWRRWADLKTERNTWMSHWSELSRYLLPRNGRFIRTDRNRGTKRHNDIYDNTGTRASRVLSAGMMSTMTSPARPWFKLRTPNAELNKHQSVKVWLEQCTQVLHTIFARSNTYRMLHQGYAELGVFGTSAAIMAEDFRTVIHHHPLTIGEYAVATDWQGRPNTLGREFEKTVAEVVREFGLENCSQAVQSMWNRGVFNAWVPLIHIIEPRDESERDHRSKAARDMPWRSVYFEAGASPNKTLRDSGFKSFPAIVTRWDVAGGDVYGNSPGMECLGDVKQLQQEQLRKGQAIDYQTKPPMMLPAGMKNSEVDMLPGGQSFGDGEPKPMFEANLRLDHLLEDIRDVRERIRGSFFVDVFLMLAQVDVGKMTATEVAARQEEKMLMLGPVTDRVYTEQLEPLIDFGFTRALAAGLLPPAPPELRGQMLQVELIGVMAQAQRAIGANTIDRFVGNLGQVATFAPGVLDKFDADAWVDAYADQTGVDPALVVASDQVALIRQNRAQAAQQAQQNALANQAADTAQKLGNTPLGDGSALAALVSGGGLTQTDNVMMR